MIATTMEMFIIAWQRFTWRDKLQMKKFGTNSVYSIGFLMSKCVGVFFGGAYTKGQKLKFGQQSSITVDGEKHGIGRQLRTIRLWAKAVVTDLCQIHKANPYSARLYGISLFAHDTGKTMGKLSNESFFITFEGFWRFHCLAAGKGQPIAKLHSLVADMAMSWQLQAIPLT